MGRVSGDVVVLCFNCEQRQGALLDCGGRTLVLRWTVVTAAAAKLVQRSEGPRHQATAGMESGCRDDLQCSRRERVLTPLQPRGVTRHHKTTVPAQPARDSFHLADRAMMRSVVERGTWKRGEQGADVMVVMVMMCCGYTSISTG